MKMPDPIMDPMTRAVEEKSPRLWTIPEAAGAGEVPGVSNAG
jgi:hypothetical protein